MVTVKKISLYTLAVFYIAAGFMHFVRPEFYMKIMPPYIPYHLFMVYFSGVCEIALGIALLIPAYRRLAAWGVIALLIAVYPANIYHYQSGGAGMDISETALLIRLFVQFLFIAWAYWHTRE